MKIIDALVPSSKALDLVFNDDSFIMRAAELLSYSSLAYLWNSGMSYALHHEFTQDSQALQLFINNLKKSNRNFEYKVKVLRALRLIRRFETEQAVLTSESFELMKMLWIISKAKDEDEPAEELEDNDDDY